MQRSHITIIATMGISSDAYEARKFNKDKTQLVRKGFVRFAVEQHDIGLELLRSVLQGEVHEEYAVDGLDVEHPFGAFHSLP